MAWFAIGSYLCAALAFGAVGTMLVVSHPGGRAATALAAAALLTSVWAGGIVFQLLSDRPAAQTIVMLDVLHVLARSEEHTSELQSQSNLVCRLLLEKKKKKKKKNKHENT